MIKQTDKAWLDHCIHDNYQSLHSSISNMAPSRLRNCFDAIMNEAYDANDATIGALRILCQWNDPNGEYDDAPKKELIDILYRGKFENENAE